jgi:hypothetical protein
MLNFQTARLSIVQHALVVWTPHPEFTVESVWSLFVTIHLQPAIAIDLNPLDDEIFD